MSLGLELAAGRSESSLLPTAFPRLASGLLDPRWGIRPSERSHIKRGNRDGRDPDHLSRPLPRPVRLRTSRGMIVLGIAF
jgi:hypothetical protein